MHQSQSKWTTNMNAIALLWLMSPPYKYKNADLVIRKMARLHIEYFSESHLFSVFLGCLYKCNCHIRCYINVDELMNSAFGLLCNIFFQFLQNLLIWNNNYYRYEYNKIHTHAASLHAFNILNCLNTIDLNII